MICPFFSVRMQSYRFNKASSREWVATTRGHIGLVPVGYLFFRLGGQISCGHGGGRRQNGQSHRNDRQQQAVIEHQRQRADAQQVSVGIADADVVELTVALQKRVGETGQGFFRGSKWLLTSFSGLTCASKPAPWSAHIFSS